MSFDFIGGWSYWGPAAVFAIAVLAVAIARAPWAQFWASSERLHAFAIGAIGLSLFWLLKVKVEGMLTLHPLLIMSAVVVFGWELGVILGAIALLLNGAFEGSSIQALIMPLAFNVIVPAIAAQMVLAFIARLSFRNLFVFMLGGGFFGAMATVQAMAATQWLYIAALGPEPLQVIASDHYYLSLLMMFPEGFINGALITLMTVLSPHLVKTYDDHRYLDDL